MAAYAAAVSLMHILDLIKNHPSPPISFDKQQLHSLTEVVTFLQEFLESYVSPSSYSDEAEPFEMRIAEAVYAAEDVIESYIVDNIHHASGTTHDDAHDDDDVMKSYSFYEDEQIRYYSFYEGLRKVIGAMDLINKAAMEMDMEKAGVEAELPRNVSVDVGFKYSSIERKIEMVGFDDVRLELLDRLTSGDSNRQIITIVGMGGIGKTTLARNVFADKLVKEHFDICLWATISQDHSIERTLRQVLYQAKLNSSGESVGELGEELHKYLFGRRYLVVLDDMWSIEVWDKMRFFLPDCSQRSRVIVTTRISNLAAYLTNSSNSLSMSFLNEADSWTLFSKTVFGSEGSVSDLELREIGEKIVGKCKGLPLSIAVIGGLLAKSEHTQGYWEYIEENLSSTVNLDNEEYCLRVLKLSYNHLPAYLKPCFLYMGVFDEDIEVEISTIINMWVSEGFVKPRKNKNLERVAREYFQELVDRNLVLLHDEAGSDWGLFSWFSELGLVGITKYCKIHDLVRDLSLREAQKQRFYYVHSSKLHNPTHQETSSYPRRIVIPSKNLVSSDLEYWPNSRSFVCHNDDVSQFPNFRLLRILCAGEANYKVPQKYSQEDVFGVLVNSRLLAIAVKEDEWLHSSISRLWSLHTLILHCEGELKGPVEFWNMHLLKHVEFTQGRLRLQLPPPRNDNDDNIVIMENLHTLIGMVDFHLNEDVVRRMPNLLILKVFYEMKLVNGEVHCLSHLQRLTKLESFACSITKESGENLQWICFPQSLNQIFLQDYYYSPQIQLEDVLQKIGCLPFVEELLLLECSFGRGEWETTEDQFPRLKILQLICCRSLEKWTVSEASHFPLLQRLVLEYLQELEEIPPEIGEIATLRLIEVRYCSEAVVLSAKL